MSLRKIAKRQMRSACYGATTRKAKCRKYRASRAYYRTEGGPYKLLGRVSKLILSPLKESVPVPAESASFTAELQTDPETCKRLQAWMGLSVTEADISGNEIMVGGYCIPPEKA